MKKIKLAEQEIQKFEEMKVRWDKFVEEYDSEVAKVFQNMGLPKSAIYAAFYSQKEKCLIIAGRFED